MTNRSPRPFRVQFAYTNANNGLTGTHTRTYASADAADAAVAQNRQATVDPRGAEERPGVYTIAARIA